MDLVKRIMEQLGGAGLQGRAVALAAALVAALALVGVVWSSRSADMALLYADLPEGDAARVVEKLRAAQVPYQLGSDGRSVQVPWNRVAELRLEMAADGVIQGNGNGLELFERGPFGQSELAEEVTYTRALQGELSRTIAALDPVERAMVHVGRPRPSVFVSEDRPASASVVVRLRPGRRLSPRQLAGIRALVSASVQGLTAERVSILDESGAALAGPGADTDGEPGGLDRERATEEHLTRKAQTLLDAAFGPGKAIVRITARLTREKVEERREKIDPQGVARSEQTSSRTSRQRGADATALAAGTASNVPGAAAVRGGGAGDREETEETTRTEYDLGRTTQVVVREAGALERLTIGLLLEEKLADQASKIEAIVKEAVGFDPRRGDTVQTQAIPMQAGGLLETATAEMDEAGSRARVMEYADRGIAVLAALIAAGLGGLALRRGAVAPARPTPGAPASPPGAPAPAGGAPGAVAVVGGAPPAPLISDAERRQQLRVEASQQMQQSPDLAGQLLDQWLSEERGGAA